MNSNKFSTVDEYISLQQNSMKAGLEIMRQTIKQAAPKAEEVISYNMPAYKFKGMLVYFAAAKNHYGFYPTASPIKVFADKISKYKHSKGAIQFPLDEPLPLKLITEIVKFKLSENIAKIEAKKLLK